MSGGEEPLAVRFGGRALTYASGDAFPRVIEYDAGGGQPAFSYATRGAVARRGAARSSAGGAGPRTAVGGVERGEQWDRKVLVSHATEHPAALNAAHAIVDALRQHKDPSTGKPFSTHCHADSRTVDLWLDCTPEHAMKALGEGPCAIFLVGNAFCASRTCAHELLHATLKGTATIPLILEQPCSSERQFQAWVADIGGPATRELSFDADEVNAIWCQARASSTVPADLFSLADLVCSDCRLSIGAVCPSCSKWAVATKQASGDFTEALRWLGRLVDANVESALRGSHFGSGSFKGAPDSSFSRPGEFLSVPAQTPQLEPEPELSQEDSMVEILVPGECVEAEGSADMSAVVTEMKAAIVAALWSEMEHIDVVAAGGSSHPEDRRLTVKMQNCPATQVAATLMQRVACDALDVQLCRHETSVLHIRIVIAGLPRWAAAALAGAVLGGGAHQNQVSRGPAETRLPRAALTRRIQAILRAESARFQNVRFTNDIKVIVDGAAVAVTVDAAMPVQEDTSIGRPRSTASAASIEEPDEKRLRPTAAATEDSVGGSTSADMISSDASSDVAGPEVTRIDDSMRNESDSGGSAGGDMNNSGAGTETESQSCSDSESDEDASLAGGSGTGSQTGRQDRMTAPVVKLSFKLIETYNHINEVYYSKQKEKKKWDDEKSDYVVRPGDLIGRGRYRLKKVIGSGSFGQVVSAIDTKVEGLCDACALPEDTKGRLPGLPCCPHHPHGRCEVAIKIIKNKPAFHRQAKIEIELLTLLNRLQQSNSRFDPNLVRMLAHFTHRDHIWCVPSPRQHICSDYSRSC